MLARMAGASLHLLHLSDDGSPSEDAQAQEITAYATDRGADVIVMGTRGCGANHCAALGRVAERVVRTAPCPVLIVRESGSVKLLELARRRPQSCAPPGWLRQSPPNHASAE
jgi:hypothetical protein